MGLQFVSLFADSAVPALAYGGTAGCSSSTPPAADG